MEKTTLNPAATASMKHLRTLFVDKYLENTVKHLCTKDVPETFGGLKDQLDGPLFNILMTLVKEKMQGLGPFAQNEFEEMCAEMGLEDKFRQVETQEAAKVAAAQAVVTAAEKKKSDAVAAALATAAAAVRRKGGNGPAGQVGEEDSSDRLGGMTPEGLARHRRMVIKRKELTELQGMHEKEASLYSEAEEDLKVAKNKMKEVYNDLGTLAPEAQRLLQRCVEN